VRQILALLLLICFATSAAAWNTALFSGGGGPGAGLTCQLWYSYTTDTSGTNSVSRYNGRELVGFTISTGASARDVCQLDIHIETVAGDVTGKDYYASIMTVVDYGGGDYDLDHAQHGTSAKIEGEDLASSANAWISDNTGGLFVFSPAVTLTSGTFYGFIVWVDTDADADIDSDSEDGTNYITWSFCNGCDNQNDHIKREWAGADAGVHGDTVNDATDDMMVRIYTMQ
jgi:hypothetical protein